MTDRQINKWLRKRFSEIGWVLIGYYVLMNCLVLATAAIDTVRQVLWNIAAGMFPLDLDMDALINNGWGYALAMAVGFAILYAWKGTHYWKQEIFAKEKKMTFLVFFCTVSLCMGSQMLSTLWLTAVELVMNSFGSSVMPMLETVSGGTETFSMFLYSALLAPLSEEILFRGYVLRTLRPYGKRLAIFGSALLFGLFHGNILQGPYAFLVGLILGYLACEYSIHWAIALHVFNNLVLAEGLTRLTEQMPAAMADMVHFVLFGVFFAVSVVILTVKRRQIREYNRAEWMDRRCVKCFLTNAGILIFTAMMVGNMLSLLLV